jgi:hypothetical protein
MVEGWHGSSAIPWAKTESLPAPGKLTEGGLIVAHVPAVSVGVAPVAPPGPPSTGHVGGTNGAEVLDMEVDPLGAAFATPEPLDTPELGDGGLAAAEEIDPESAGWLAVFAGTAADGSPPHAATKEIHADAFAMEFMIGALNG